jgi:ABC-type branched-subunit amino acid transport system substrate-binding protein
MVQCNHNGSVDVVADLAEYLVDTIQVPAILGPASSSATSAAFSRANLAENGDELRKALFVSPSATSVALTNLETTTPGMLWRTAPTDDGQGRLMGEYAKETGTTFIAFYEDTPYGRGLFEELENSAGDLCDECGFSFEADSSDVVPLTRMLASDDTIDALAEVETVFFMGAQETHLNEMFKRLNTPEFADKVIFFSDAAASADTVAGAGDSIDRVIGTRPRAAEEGEATRFFTAAYEGRHDESPLIHSFTTHAYDATWLILLSAIRAKLSDLTITPETIAAGLRSMSSSDWSELGDDCPINLDEGVCPPLTLDQTYLTPIIESFENFGTIDVRGASGSLDYDLQTEELADSADAFEFWYLQSEMSDDITIVGGTPPPP